MCLDDGAGILYVTSGPAGRGAIEAISLASGRTLARANAGHYPCAPTLVGGGRVAYADRFRGRVVFCDAQTLATVGTVDVTREPIDMAWSAKEGLLVVAHHLPDKGAACPVVSANITLISTKKMATEAVVPLRNGSTSVKRVALSPDGTQAAVTHVLARYTLHTSQLEQGWENTNAVTFIDLGARRMGNTFLLDEPYQGAANPWGVAWSPDGRHLYVTHAGSHEVSDIDMDKLAAKVAAAARDVSTFRMSDPVAFENNLAFLGDARVRRSVAGKGPRDVVAAGSKLWVADYFSDAIEALEGGREGGPASHGYNSPQGQVAESGLRVAASRPLRPSPVRSQPPAFPTTKTASTLADPSASRCLIVVGNPTMDDARRGEMLFHDAGICFEQWQSCSSCHPDARVDGLNWDLMNDRLGNPKNTLSLLYSQFSPPAMSTGIRPTAQYAVRAGMRLIQFSEPDEKDAKAIDAYLYSLKALPSPYLVDGDLSPAARKGREIFRQLGCADCHNGPYYSDRKLHDVGTWTPIDMTTTADGQPVRQTQFVTARLTEMWRTAPYLHSGEYYTVGELVDHGSHARINATTKKLSEEEKKNLVEYILSL